VGVDELHLDQARAESFGSMAQQYDRYRATYPDALFDDLAALEPMQVLDVGCGTGKAAVALARHGLSVLGVDLDERMADVARGHGIAVEVAAFETWEDAGRQFDLITCAEAWHWIDPILAIPKAARLLRVGGTIALFRNTYRVDESVIDAFDAVYRRHAPEVTQVWRPTESTWHPFGVDGDPFAGNDTFSSVETRSYRWERTLSADEWVGLAATVSDHKQLGHERLAALLQALYALIQTLGGTVHSHDETHLMLARRAVT
jgi:ubiquinone/menaquinone biosynthesis C-methylase UbiE